MSDGSSVVDQPPVSADDIINGAHVVTTVAELLDIFGKFPQFAESLAPFAEPAGGILVVITSVIQVIKAMGTEERGAGYRGTAYGLVYGALGMGTPSATCSGSDNGPDQDKLNQDAFNKGASEGAAKGSGDPITHNRILCRIALAKNDPQPTVVAIYQALCAGSDDKALSDAYSDALSWPAPVCA
jgi:hypothetical protein